jgi:hypothetical protein
MAMPKPAKSKAPASVQPVGGYHSKAATHDPCCVPGGVETGSSVNGSSKAKDDNTFYGTVGAVGHIANPTAH